MIRNITLSAEDAIIDLARARARAERKSLNTIFREWLTQYVGQMRSATTFTRLMRKLRYAKPGRSFTRDDFNAR